MITSFPTAIGVPCVLLLTACSAQPAQQPTTDGQSYTQAIDTICRVDELAKLDPEQDVLGVDTQRFEYLGDHVDNPDGIFFRTVLSVKPPQERATMLLHEADVAKVEHCPLAAFYQTDADQGLQ